MTCVPSLTMRFCSRCVWVGVKWVQLMCVLDVSKLKLSVQIGLDYHYDFSPREKQQEILIRQLKHAIALGKPITIHTREGRLCCVYKGKVHANSHLR